MRICIVYDCLYPYTVGGAERFYRGLAERLATEGHEVTYLTLRQWASGASAEVPGVRILAVGPRMGLYTRGRRRLLPPLVFGLGVLRHLRAHGHDYDAVLTGSFPYFPLLATAAVRRRKRFDLVVDWPEVWTRSYWREYLGPLGVVGDIVQRRCIRVRQRAICPSELTAGRLRDAGVGGGVTVYRGLYDRTDDPGARTGERESLVVFAGRHIPEKRVTTIVPALERARETVRELRAEILGDGPDRQAVLDQVQAHRLQGVVEAPGFVDRATLEEALGRALCLLLPSRREGYGLIVVEAAARGVPSIVVAGPDNAATELVEDGVNGIVAESADPGELAAAIVRIHGAGQGLRDSTTAWFDAHASELSLATSVATVSRLLEARPDTV